jgi:hypothetical protein
MPRVGCTFWHVNGHGLTAEIQRIITIGLLTPRESRRQRLRDLVTLYQYKHMDRKALAMLEEYAQHCITYLHFGSVTFLFFF